MAAPRERLQRTVSDFRWQRQACELHTLCLDHELNPVD